MVLSQYAVLIFSGLAGAAAVYLIYNSLSPHFVASNVTVLTAVSLKRRDRSEVRLTSARQAYQLRTFYYINIAPGSTLEMG